VPAAEVFTDFKAELGLEKLNSDSVKKHERMSEELGLLFDGSLRGQQIEDLSILSVNGSSYFR